METIKILEQTATPHQLGILELLVESQAELEMVMGFKQYNKVCSMGACHTKIEQNLAQAVEVVVGYRDVLELCTYAEELRVIGISWDDLPNELK